MPASCSDEQTQIYRGGALHQYRPLDRFETWGPHRIRPRCTRDVYALIYDVILRYTPVFLPRSIEPSLCDVEIISEDDIVMSVAPPQARFWDQPPTNGRSVSIDGIRVNIERQQLAPDQRGAPAPRFFRSSGWREASMSITNRPHPIRLRTQDDMSYSFYLDVLFSPFNAILSSEAIEAFDRWEVDDPRGYAAGSGSGPYIPAACEPGAELVLVRAENDWAAPSPPRRLSRSRPSHLDAVAFAAGSPADVAER